MELLSPYYVFVITQLKKLKILFLIFWFCMGKKQKQWFKVLTKNIIKVDNTNLCVGFLKYFLISKSFKFKIFHKLFTRTRTYFQTNFNIFHNTCSESQCLKKQMSLKTEFQILAKYLQNKTQLELNTWAYKISC